MKTKTKASLLTIVAGLTLVTGTTAFAAENSVITAGEQQVIAAAEKAAGSHLTPKHIIQANNYMKTVDISDENANTIVNNISNSSFERIPH